ncbi:hypothetical protein ACHWQZ_G016285 [Mnemiopsis leidyi]
MSEVQKSEGPRTSPKIPVQFWNHYSTIMVDPDYPRTSNLVKGFHRGFKTRVNRARPTVQKYFRAIREQQVTTDIHLDRLAVGLTPSKKRRTSSRDLFAICTGFEDHSSTLEDHMTCGEVVVVVKLSFEASINSLERDPRDSDEESGDDMSILIGDSEDENSEIEFSEGSDDEDD